MSTAPKTLFEKVWQQHVVVEPAGEPTVLYIDLQLLHEVTSRKPLKVCASRPQGSAALTAASPPSITTSHHPRRRLHILDQIAATQIDALRKNCADFGVDSTMSTRANKDRARHRTRARHHQPGMTIVCG